METIRDSFLQCRLCGIHGLHEIDILGSESHNGQDNADALSEKIFRCVGIRVQRIDRITTKICRNCVEKINDFVLFREICASTNMQLRLSLSNQIVGSLVVDVDAVLGDATQIQLTPHEDFTSSVGSVTTKLTHFDVDLSGKETNESETMRPDSPSVAQSAVFHPSAVNQANFAKKRSSQAHSGNGVRSVSIRKNGGSNTKKASNHTFAQCSNTYRQRQPENSVDTSRHVDDEPVIFVSLTHDETDSEQEEVASNSRKVGTPNENVAVKRKRSVNAKIAESGGNVQVKCSRGNCTQMFQSSDAMWYHASNYHIRGVMKTFECHLCRKNSQCIKNLQIHMNSFHVGDKCFQCPFSNCSKKFPHKGNIRKHIERIHTKKIRFKCTKCSFKSYDKQYFGMHVARHHQHAGPR